MNRKLLAASVGALFATAAQAQTSSVILYGSADGDFRVDHTAIGNLRSVGSGGESGTRWGIRGAEDLGGGLKAIFNFEQGFDLSDNSVPQGNVAATASGNATNSTGSRLFSRTATVGLSSVAAGDLRFGRAYIPFYVLYSAVDPMGGGLVGGAQNYALGTPSRFDNAIYYDSPKFYGLQLSGAFRLGESTTNGTPTGTPPVATAPKNGNNGGNASLTYAAGPILAGYTYLSQKNALDNNTTRSQFAGGAYDFKVFKLHALAFTSRNATTTHLRSYAVGATVPIQAFSVFAEVGRIDNRYNSVANTQNDDATFFGLGADYNFSKRTNLYTSWAKFKNKNNATYGVQDASNFGLETTTGALANVTPGFDPWSVQIGIRHKF